MYERDIPVEKIITVLLQKPRCCVIPDTICQSNLTLTRTCYSHIPLFLRPNLSCSPYKNNKVSRQASDLADMLIKLVDVHV